MTAGGGHRAGVDVGGTKIAIGLADPMGALIDGVRFPTRDDAGREHGIARIASEIAALLARCAVGPRQLAAVGMGFPGDLEPGSGRVKTAPNNPSFVGTNPAALLQDALRARLGVRPPIWMDNDACVAALAEATAGAGRGARRFLYLTISTDVGGARVDGDAICNLEPGLRLFPDPEQPGEPLLRLGGGVPAAELAKARIRAFVCAHGPSALPRLTDLFDLPAAGEALDARIASLTAQQLGEASGRGDRFAAGILHENALQVARAIVLLQEDGAGDDQVVLGGSVATRVPFYVEAVRAALRRCAPHRDLAARVVAAELAEDRGVQGAIALIGRAPLGAVIRIPGESIATTVGATTGAANEGETTMPVSIETRWCDNQDGTVTDRATGLVWLKRASWGGSHPFWADDREKPSAHDRASSLCSGAPGADLCDASTEGDWRLPTLAELASLISGTEAVSAWDMRAFTGVEPAPYWSSTSYSRYPSRGYFVHLLGGNIGSFNKKTGYFVWPVRSTRPGLIALPGTALDAAAGSVPPYVLRHEPGAE
jgi:glucokinase